MQKEEEVYLLRCKMSRGAIETYAKITNGTYFRFKIKRIFENSQGSYVNVWRWYTLSCPDINEKHIVALLQPMYFLTTFSSKQTYTLTVLRGREYEIIMCGGRMRRHSRGEEIATHMVIPKTKIKTNCLIISYIIICFW